MQLHDNSRSAGWGCDRIPKKTEASPTGWDRGTAPLAPDRLANGVPMTERKNRMVLVVDCSGDAREITGELLASAGYPVKTAASLKEARNICSETKIDLMLIEYEMPGMDGLDFAKEMKGIQPDMTVVVISAWGDDRLNDAVGRHEVANLQKPFTSTALEATVDSMLSAKSI